ncbi:MAG TPA: TIGR00730 family Rossman fold protein [Phenylobacterium sp.]
MGGAPERLDSVCVYCSSSNAADPAFLAAAAELGRALAAAGLRLVYGGGGVGLMGACALAAHEAGGKVLGIIPQFLVDRERPLHAIETVVVESMHERKMQMFEAADAFVVLPGGIGTLEEVIELLSWRRLELHRKPIVFYNPGGFWDGLFGFFAESIAQNLTPPEFRQAWSAVSRIDQVVPLLQGADPQTFENDTAVARLS